MSAVAAWLPDRRRLHYQHGPIDLVLEAWGEPQEVGAAYRAAWARFQSILAELVAELPLLRRPVEEAASVRGPVARRMVTACRPHLPIFITPMAAVAGAVADEVLGAMTAGRRLAKAYVNDGGDIAVHLAPGESLRVGLVADLALPALSGLTELPAAVPVRGIATSGRGGRSFSLGIADSATVFAANAAAADAAATLVANAVDIDDPAVTRVPAVALDPDSDLGARLVTTEVGPLSDDAVATALDRGAAAATVMRGAGLIFGAVLVLRGRFRVVGDLGRLPAAA